jgi:DNA-binding transcriptional LysR family regulator
MTDDIGELRAFLAVVDGAGFTAAASQLGLTPSAVSKIVGRLEDRLDVRLFDRTTRRVAPTAEGDLFAARVRRVLAELAEAEAEIVPSAGQVRGRLRINSGTAFANNLLMPLVAGFRALHPEVAVEVEVTDGIVDLVEAGADVAIRTTLKVDDHLVARHLRDIRRVIVAAPDYLHRHGPVLHPDDLARHECVGLTIAPNLRQWPFHIDGVTRRIEAKGAVTVGSAETLRAAALAGVGIIRVADMVVGDAIADGRLVPLLEVFHVDEPVPVHAVSLPGRHRAPRVRAFVDHLARSFKRL